ncbi:hypothetical protein [Persephonella sp.]|uniref:hypothetical protein n=1 Tax=Persephonella sp. TaxID=2060922 RepID=UPI0026045FC8|nr:hypothetical protein [Persephonella sp.]
MRYQILDVYSNSYGIVLWLIGEKGDRKSVFRRFRPYFFIKAEDTKALKLLKKRFGNSIKIKKTRKKDLIDGEIQLFKIVSDSPAVYHKAVSFVKSRKEFQETDLYNLQLTPSQLFMFEKKIFPFCQLEEICKNGKTLYKKIDDYSSTDYMVFPLKIMEIKPETEGENPNHTKNLPPLIVNFEGRSLIFDSQTDELSDFIKKKTLTYLS